MKTLLLKIFKSYHNSSLISKFLCRFSFTLIVPTVLLWIVYLSILHIYFISNTLDTQQTYLENSVTPIQMNVTNADTIFSSLEGMPELLYYLDVYSEKADMLYSLKKYIIPQTQNLLIGNASIDSIRIYSHKTDLLYTDPFYSFDAIPLNEEEKETLLNSSPMNILWHVLPGSPDKIPELYAYKKLYAYDFKHVIGYMELKINPQILSEYLVQFQDPQAFHGADYALYQENQLIYSHLSRRLLSEEQLVELDRNMVVIDYLHGTYINHVVIPDVDLRLVLTGSLNAISCQPADVLVIAISMFILLLLVLLLRFFSYITDLSRQIMDFSTYIRNSDPDDLTLYSKQNGYRERYEELDHLVNSYNDLIQENSTLMTRVRKMELLSQDARYQALQSQIHPHFIYGTLENIRMLALQNQDRDVAEMVFSLSTLIRRSISISDRSVTLEEELETAKHYLTIQKYRFGDRLRYTFQIEDGWQHLLLPSFTLQPILENSILYGVSQTLDDCKLKVYVSSDPKVVTIRLSNSGKTITAKRLLEVNALLDGRTELSHFQGTHNGCALYNIKERLRIYYHEHTSMQMAIEDDSTVTIITIERSGLHVSNFNS